MRVSLKVWPALARPSSVASRSKDKIERVAEEIRSAGGKALAVPADVTDRGALVNLAETAISTFGGLHCWVHNACGSPVRAALNQLPDEEWEACIDLNLTAVWKGSVIAFEYMDCLLYTSPSPRDQRGSRMPSSA